MRQPTFFEKDQASGQIDDRALTLYALGDFQSRGKVLAERELPLDRLRGALRRATELNGLDEMTDERAVEALRALGANVRQVPAFFAKHPFRVTVPVDLADRARDVYAAQLDADKRD